MIVDNAESVDNSQETKLTSWKSEPSFNDLYEDYKQAQEDHSQWLLKLDERKVNLDGGPELEVPKGKSTVRPKLIRKQHEWLYPSLEEPFLNTEDMFDIKPRTAEDVNAAKQNSLMLNYQWATKVDKVKLVGDIVRTDVDEGTVIVKTGWVVEEEIVEVEKDFPVYASPEESYMMLQQAVESGQMDPAQAQAMLESGEPVQTGVQTQIVEEPRLIKNHPTYEVCNNYNVIIDPTCEGVVENAQFIIHEYETDMNTLKKQEYSCEVCETVVDGVSTTTKEEQGIYKNLDKVVLDSKAREFYNEYEQQTTFEFKDKARKKLTAYEYWGYWDIDGSGETTAVVATWIGKVLVRMEENPFPHGELPFSVERYMPVKGEVYGETDGDLLAENQDSIGKMTRAAHDITADQAIGQEFIDEQFFASPLQKDNYKAGRTVYFRSGKDPRTSIHKNSVTPVPRTVFDMIGLQKEDAETYSSVRPFGGDTASQNLGNKNTQSRSALDATSKRQLSTLRRLSNLFKDMARKTIIMNQAYLDEEEVVRVTAEEFVKVRREDLMGEFDLKIDVSTPEKDQQEAQELTMLLQTNGPQMDPKMYQITMAKIARLMKQPDLAKQYEEHEPQPDPMQQQLQQMEMEKMQLEMQKLQMEIADLAKGIESEDSKITERNSRVEQNLRSEMAENFAEARKKNAQAELTTAQADKLRSETDLLDQKFVRSNDGLDRIEKLEDEAMKHDRKMNEREHQRVTDLDKQAFTELNKRGPQ